jgi:CheY-like chemotaxis protein
MRLTMWQRCVLPHTGRRGGFMPAMHHRRPPIVGRGAIMTSQWLAEGASVLASPAAQTPMNAVRLDPGVAPVAPPTLVERPTVLVVEDDDDIAQMLDDLLSSVGYRVSLACDGETGFARAVREQPSVVLSDFIMPGMDGGQLIGKLRTHPRTRAIPVALMSSSPSSEARVLGVPFLLKPFDLEDVLALLTRAQRGGALTRYGEG